VLRGHACIAVGLSVRVGGEPLEGTHCARAGVRDWPASGRDRRGRVLREQESLEGMREKEDEGQDGLCANCGGGCRAKRISELNAGSIKLKRTCITKSPAGLLGQPADALWEREHARVRERRRGGRVCQPRVVHQQGGNVEDAVRMGPAAAVVCACQAFVGRLGREIRRR
jgi:hypothetical protein